MTDAGDIPVRFQRAMDRAAKARIPDPPTLPEILDRARRRQADPERLRLAQIDRALTTWESTWRVMSAEVPVSYREAARGLLGSTDARSQLRNALRSGRRLVLLCGPLGRGKSTAAAECVRDALIKRSDDNGQIHGTPLRWRSADWVGRLSGYEARPILDDLAAVWLLVLDDLGTETDTRQGGASGNLEGLLRDRHARHLPTIVTTNLQPDQPDPSKKPGVLQRYGARLLDRFREEGAAVLVCGGPNLRATRGAEAACGEG